MLEHLRHFFDILIGPDGVDPTHAHMAVRAAIVYLMAIFLMRIGKKRFLAKPSSFDLVLLLILGSVISRAITGSAPFFPTILAAMVLVVLHTIMSYLTFYYKGFGVLVKGRPLLLIKDGKIQWQNMKTSQLTERDLMSALRRNGQVLEVSAVKLAILERNGEISVIRYPRDVRVLDVDVAGGVQIVRLVLTEQEKETQSD